MKSIVAATVVVFLCIFVLNYFVVKSIDDHGGLQCFLAPIWNQSIKPEGCK